MKLLPRKQAGFTLIELVMVIVLIGVLSYGASSLFASKDRYVDYLAKERLLSLGLLAQQLALGMSAQEVSIPGSATPPSGDPAEIQIARSAGGDITFSLFKHQQAVRNYLLETPVPAVSVDGVSLSAGSSVSLAWDQAGNIDDGTNHNVTISGASAFYICFSSSGFVYENSGVCP
jgi:prepilin-type N-terminal cleavage/methylation domain-containing protein